MAGRVVRPRNPPGGLCTDVKMDYCNFFCLPRLLLIKEKKKGVRCLTQDDRCEWFTVWSWKWNCRCRCNCDCNYVKLGRQPLERLQPDYGQSRYRGLVARCGQVHSVHVHVGGSARSDC